MKKPKLRLIVPPKPEDLEFYDIDLSKLPSRYREGNLLAVRLVGRSLTNAGIFDGYMCIVAVGTKVKSGALAGVKANGETLIRYYYFGPGGSVRLQSGGSRRVSRQRLRGGNS